MHTTRSPIIHTSVAIRWQQWGRGVLKWTSLNRSPVLATRCYTIGLFIREWDSCTEVRAVGVGDPLMVRSNATRVIVTWDPTSVCVQTDTHDGKHYLRWRAVTIVDTRGPPNDYAPTIFTACKRSFGQGNMFTGVCLSTGGVPGPGRVPGPGGVSCPRGVPGGDPPHGYCCGRYASYWNAFLFRMHLHWMKQTWKE